MATLHLQLLGGFSLSIADRRIALGGRAHALLGYLALHGDAPRSRQQIAACFWPDVPESQGRNNLRQLVHQLRQSWPELESYVELDARALQWRAEASAHVDVIELPRAVAAARALGIGERTRARELLGRAARSYAGDLLPDCHDEWIAPHRERLRGQLMAALDLLVRLAEDDRDHGAAITHGERLVELEPLDERGYLRLMRLHSLAHDVAAARRVYAACVDTLARELGIAPGAELRDAHQRLARRAEVPVPHGDRPPPLIGRTRELAQLQHTWQRVEPRTAMLALVTGEAGLGKTRLGEETLAWAAEQGIAVARTRAYAVEGRLALSPITGWLRSEPVRESLARLDPLWRTEVSRLLSELLIEHPELPRPAPLAEYWQRQQFFEALARAVTGAAPALLLMVDDLQWCDGDTLEWLHYLLRFPSEVRLFVIGTVRSDEITAEHPLARLTTALRRSDQLVEVPLTPLDAAETARLAAGIAGSDLELDAAFRLFSQTEGNPLFVVETVRGGLDHVLDQVPPKVHSVITGRLNQLSPDAREVAGLAATIGRAFSIDVLSAASDLGELRVAHALDELWQRRIVRDDASDTWDFTHDRLREVAASEQPPLQRQRNHRRIAEALEAARADDLDGVSAEIATHFDEARLGTRALGYYERAARVAARVFAYDEVQALLRRALALLARQPEATRGPLELPLLVSLAAAIRVSHGWAAPALEAVHARVSELSRSIGNAEQRAAALLNSLFFNEVRADFRQVALLFPEVPAAMEPITSPALHVMAATVELGLRMFQGQFALTEDAYQRATKLYEPAQHMLHVTITGADLGVLGSAWSSHALWCRGRVADAFARVHEALALARSLGHPFSEALALAYLATVHQLCGDVERTRAYAADAHAIAERHRAIYYRAWSAILLAWVDATRAPGAAAIATLRTRIDEFSATGAGARLPYYLSLLAGLQTTEVALETIELAVETSARNGDSWWDAELHRLRGELLHRTGATARARVSLEHALAIARDQEAAILVERARDSLANLGANGRTNA